MMTEKRVQQLIAKALTSADVDRAKYYHMCWWEGRLRCLHIHHTKDVHPVFFAAPGEVFAETLNPHQWQLLTDRIMAFCRRHNVAADGRPSQGERRSRTASRQRPKVTGFDSQRLRRRLSDNHSALSPAQPHLDRLKQLLETADTVAPGEIPRDVVTMNSRVHLKDRNGEDGQRSVSLVFPAEAETDAGLETTKVSVLTPIGLAILGRRVGDRVEGRIRIQDLPYQPEAAGHFDL